MNDRQSARRFLVILAAHGEAESAGFREQFSVSWRTLAHASEVMPLAAPLHAALCALGVLPAEERSALVIVLHGTLLADKSGRPPAFHTCRCEKTHYGDTLRKSLAGLAQEGIRCVYAYPAEHLVESAETARLAYTLDASPVARGFCLPSLNDSPRFIDFLADRVRAAAAEDGACACDYCSLTARVQHSQA